MYFQRRVWETDRKDWMPKFNPVRRFFTVYLLPEKGILCRNMSYPILKYELTL